MEGTIMALPNLYRSTGRKCFLYLFLLCTEMVFFGCSGRDSDSVDQMVGYQVQDRVTGVNAKIVDSAKEYLRIERPNFDFEKHMVSFVDKGDMVIVDFSPPVGTMGGGRLLPLIKIRRKLLGLSFLCSCVSERCAVCDSFRVRAECL
jgi:hypothetical protein